MRRRAMWLTTRKGMHIGLPHADGNIFYAYRSAFQRLFVRQMFCECMHKCLRILVIFTFAERISF